MITEAREISYEIRRRSIAAAFKTGSRKLGIVCLILAATAMVSLAQDEQPSTDSVKFTTLLNFDGTDGGNPFGPLVQGLDGDLYGTAYTGGSSAYCSPAGTCGTVFKITPNGSLTTIYSFCSQPNCATDGSNPQQGLTLGTDGNFYGTTSLGGSSFNSGACPPYGCGTTFKITPAGELTTLYNWCSQPNCTDGTWYFGGLGISLIPVGDGNLYGATSGGGTSPAPGAGTIFRLTPTGQLTTLYNFCLQNGCPDGSHPVGLTQGSDGNFYGVTYYGGANPILSAGTVFKITPGGKLTTLYKFCSQGGRSCTDGDHPFSPLIEATDGNFYGTTGAGGVGNYCPPGDGGCGTFFKITPEGALTTIYNFCSQSNCDDGNFPGGWLSQGTDGNFYGETEFGGANGDGTLFKLTPEGVLTTLYSFDTPDSSIGNGVVQATNGYFYGPTYTGGITNSSLCYGPDSTCGTVFGLSDGLGPFVETLPTSGNAGEQIRILGTNLTGATGVSFNGTAAVYKVISPTLISATVPADATTGFVTVTTPSGTLQSNVKFQVKP